MKDGRLALHDERLGPSEIAHLRGLAPSLRDLSLAECEIEGGASALFDGGISWPVLERLVVAECGALDAVVHALASAPWTDALRVLSLAGEDVLSAAGVAGLLRSPRLASLSELSLAGIGADADVLQAIAHARLFDRLVHLGLDYPCDALAVVEAVANRAMPALETLFLRGAGALGGATVMALVGRARRPRLVSLDLEAFDVADDVERAAPPGVTLYVG